jgi:hypothetical protein
MTFAKRRWIGRALAVTLALSGCAVCRVVAQPTQQTQTDTDTVAALHSITQLAGVIFAGRVIRVHRHQGVAGAAGTVEIEFAVEDAIRGVAGDTYTLREWAGLWPADDEPFRVGQRYLMLLHASSASGLSSPIGGTDGAIPIKGEAGAVADSRAVDLRWIATRVTRSIAYRPTERPTGLPATLHPYVATPDAGASDESASMNTIPAAHSASYATVIAMLKRWQKDDDAAR